jgi:hypothetical protein
MVELGSLLASAAEIGGGEGARRAASFREPVQPARVLGVCGAGELTAERCRTPTSTTARDASKTPMPVNTSSTSGVMSIVPATGVAAAAMPSIAACTLAEARRLAAATSSTTAVAIASTTTPGMAKTPRLWRR